MMIRSSLFSAAALALLAVSAHAAPARTAPAAKAQSPTSGTGPLMGPAYFTGTWEDLIPRELLVEEAPKPAAKPEGPPVNNDPPLKPEYLAKWKAEQKAVADLIAKGEPPLTANAQCQPPGFPGMMGPVFPIEVLQTPGQVTITQEAYSQTRRIYLNQKQVPFEDAEPTYYGNSVGHWEGNTLVVNTRGLKDFIRNRGVPHSDQMEINERITVTPERVTINFTQTDPVYLTRPWSSKIEWKKRHNYKMNEFVCENNRNYADPVTGQQRLKID
jgi:hypothetical protein